MRNATFTLTVHNSCLRFEDPSPLTSPDLEAAELEEAYGAIKNLWFHPILADLTVVVSPDDFEQAAGESVFADRVLQAITGWERMEREEGRWGWGGDEWARVHEDELEESRADPWFDEATGLPSDEVLEGCEQLSILATRLAPQFVTRDYRIELQALEPRWWDLNDGRRMRIALVPYGDDVSSGPEDAQVWEDVRLEDRVRFLVQKELQEPDRTPPGFGIESVGAGLRVWAMFAVYEALRRFSKDETRATLYVFDEPERHLHPTAQREAAAFIAAIVREGANVIVTTHAPAFLNEPIPHARYVRLSRGEGVPPFHGYTRAFPLDSGRLATIERDLHELGLTRADLIQLTRGVLLVEGEHDRLILESFFGEQLGDAHVRVLTLRGTDNALALLDAELLQQLGVPLFLMLDRTSSQFVEDLNRGRITPGGTKEERALASLAAALRSKSFAVTPLALELPDIVWTLPEKAVRAVAPKFAGWKQATTDLREHKGAINPKDLLRDRYELSITIPVLRRIVAIAREHGLEPSPVLKSATATLMRSIDRPTRD